MIAALFLALVSQVAVNDGAESGLLTGRCDYPVTMGAPQLGEVRIFCDSVAVTTSKSEGMLVQFKRRSSGSTTGFGGEASDDGITIRRVYLKPGVAAPATGHCRTFRKGSDVTAVTCVAKVGWRTYVANFKPFLR